MFLRKKLPAYAVYELISAYIYTYFNSGKKSYPILCDMHLVKGRVRNLKSMVIYK